ncbi:hypothetical protein GF325_01385 [Candidatus Bathyarchaeota archaeon]|nr:hypothetical protein [Candidatus Bathyarchaeota archaeon]
MNENSEMNPRFGPIGGGMKQYVKLRIYGDGKGFLEARVNAKRGWIIMMLGIGLAILGAASLFFLVGYPSSTRIAVWVIVLSGGLIFIAGWLLVTVTPRIAVDKVTGILRRETMILGRFTWTKKEIPVENVSAVKLIKERVDVSTASDSFTNYKTVTAVKIAMKEGKALKFFSHPNDRLKLKCVNVFNKWLKQDEDMNVEMMDPL